MQQSLTQSLTNKIVFITGASSGIGAATAKQFAAAGCKLILCARRLERLKILSEQLTTEFNTEILTLPLDVSDKKQVNQAIDQLDSNWAAIDILVNNAGLALDALTLQEGNSDHWDIMIDTNIKGLLYVLRAVLPSMIKRDQGHVINISSMAGRDHYPTGNVYSATKHAVLALSKNLRLDILGTKVRVTDIAPGAVETEFSVVRWQDQNKADQFYQGFDPLVADDIADSIVFCASRPAHVNISELVIMPTDQASGNHINRKGQTGGMFDMADAD